MGAWSVSIMGGDTPLDIEYEFGELFGSTDADRAARNSFPTFRIPKNDEIISFIEDCTLGEPEIVKIVTGFLVIARAAPMSDDLRALVLEGLDAEITEGATDWNEPEKRLAVLRAFRETVEQYPNEGGQIELPHQPGLFETLAEKLG